MLYLLYFTAALRVPNEKEKIVFIYERGIYSSSIAFRAGAAARGKALNNLSHLNRTLSVL
jgi:hypothetical protein